MMDNFHFDMVCTGFDIFRNAMRLAYHQNKGWKLYNNFGYVGNYRSSLIAVLPEWAEYSE